MPIIVYLERVEGVWERIGEIDAGVPPEDLVLETDRAPGEEQDSLVIRPWQLSKAIGKQTEERRTVRKGGVGHNPPPQEPPQHPVSGVQEKP